MRQWKNVHNVNKPEVGHVSNKSVWKSATAFFTVQQFRKTNYQEWPNPGRWLTKIGQISAYDKTEFARTQNINYRDLVSPASQKRFDETSSLKPSSRMSDSGLS